MTWRDFWFVFFLIIFNHFLGVVKVGLIGLLIKGGVKSVGEKAKEAMQPGAIGRAGKGQEKDAG